MRKYLNHNCASNGGEALCRMCGAFTQHTQQRLPVVSASWTPLMLACRHGHTHLVKPLVATGADVRARSSDGAWSALSVASSMRDTETLATLLACGAQPRHDIAAGACCALMRAVLHDVPSACGCDSAAGCALCRTLPEHHAVEDPSSKQPQRTCSIKGKTDMSVMGSVQTSIQTHICSSLVSQLLAAGLLVNTPSGPQQRTPLHCAVATRDMPMARALLQCGAQVVPQSGFHAHDGSHGGQDVLNEAVDTCDGDHTMMQLLLQHLGRGALHTRVALAALQRALARNCVSCTASIAACPTVAASSHKGMQRCACVLQVAAQEGDKKDVSALRALLHCMSSVHAEAAQKAISGAL